ncbi:TonB-dependent receptor [uncultured Chitinophaga sp.]|jgi:TonB-linked outer membrane protein, SusC/RagA family|uniref:SusC/RagA family TonB-linked outer membrane protein n=1 Tax=uncultured Chitinophaga sp. TaxID=339340 RepID=UPI00262A8DDC|nr:TonB-dependent receptor [uncultured Chitinophaga sp.]
MQRRMNRSCNLICMLLLCLLCTSRLPAQSGSVVTGTVTDSASTPLPGVSITEKGKTTGTVTGPDGRYRISVSNPNATLVFTFIGYQPQEVPLNGRAAANVQLQQGSRQLGELVVVGYGTIRKSDLTGAVASVKAGDLVTAGMNNVSKALQGKIAGVQIESAGGDPGSGTRVLVRGVGTLNNNSPLYIVDGVQVTGINNLMPSDIASIEVLKDASAAAIYGSRAANGVVLVTTRSGAGGKTAISFNAYYGVQQLARKMDVLNASEWARVSNAAHDAAGVPRLDIARNPDSLGAGTDWQDEVYRTAPIQSYELNVSGGGENGNYSISGGYFNQEGIVKVTGYNRLNLRIKSETTKGRFKIGETVIISREKTITMPGGWGGQGGNPVGSAVKMIPVFQVYDPGAQGGYAGAYGPVVNVANPMAQLNLESIWNRYTNVITNAYAEVSLFKGLTYKFNLGYIYTGGQAFDYAQRYKVGELFAHATNDLWERRDERNFVMGENTLNYSNTFGKHRLQVLAGYASQVSRFRTDSASVQDLPDGVKVLDAGAGVRSSGGYELQSGLLSILGRVVYSYDDRYLLTASFRRDGSSRFSPAHRYGNFPSIALGWNIGNEEFFKPLSKTISQLKLRTSYGILGNQEMADYQYIATIATNLNYVTGVDQSKWYGAIQRALVDPNIKWENTSTFNVGVDAGFFDNKLTLTADYYIKHTTDILMNLPIPGSVGVTSDPVMNAGAIYNRGLEIAAAYNGRLGELSYGVNATFALDRNKVDKLLGGLPLYGGQPTHHGSSTTTTREGGSVGAFYLIKTDGIFNSQEEIEAYRDKDGDLIQPNASPGDIRFVDANGDGIISDEDKQYCGSAFPKFSYGLGFNARWKGFDLNMFFQGTVGNKIYNGLRMDLDGMNLEFNYSKATLNAWTPERHTDFPRAVIDDPNYNTRVSDRFLESGTYLRMRSLQLGYALPGALLRRVGVDGLRAYVSFDNLFTITGYDGYNPDIGRGSSILDRGVDFGHVEYPLTRTATIGVQLNF